MAVNYSYMEHEATIKKFLVVSFEGLAADLAWQLVKEGHDVKMHITNSEDKDVGDGFIQKIDNWKQHIDWSDCIIFDDVGFGKTADRLRKKGKLVVGGSEYTDRLENDREFGQYQMKLAGMDVLPHWDFDNFENAIEFLKTTPGRYVFKISGVSTDSYLRSFLFIGEEDDGKDLIEVLERNKNTWAKKIRRFQLQKYASGVEIAAGAFFNGADFITPININFEHKKLFPGDSGPPTGEMGTHMFFTEPNGFFNTTLGRMREKLRESHYVGYIDINCIVNGRGIYPLEYTCRFGYPHISIAMEGIVSPMGEFLLAIANGFQYPLKTKKGFQVGVVVAIPPFPYADYKMFRVYKEFSILFKKQQYDGVHIGDVKLVDGDWKIAGESGYALVVTGSNSTVEGARRHAYRRIENINLLNMFYRPDIGLKWYRESDQLRTWGIL